jgi:NAD(P)H-hydrate epimerase
LERNSELDLPPTWPPPYPRHRPICAKEARILDNSATSAFGIPSLLLMEHASRGIAEIAARLAPGGEIVVCCGPGNNGGDGYGAARFLRAWGRDVRVLQMSRALPSSPDAVYEVELAKAMGPVEALFNAPERLGDVLARGPALVIDALFGVGLSRPLGTPFLGWIDALNASGLPVLSVDIPSGMHTDSGASLPRCVQATVTASMAAPKQGFGPGMPGVAAAGHVIEVDIGLVRQQLEPLELGPGA